MNPYIYPINDLNVGKYSIHGSSGMGVSPFSKQNFADDLWNGFKAVLGSEKKSEKKSTANMSSTRCTYLIRHVNGSNMFQIDSSLSNFRAGFWHEITLN